MRWWGSGHAEMLDPADLSQCRGRLVQCTLFGDAQVVNGFGTGRASTETSPRSFSLRFNVSRSSCSQEIPIECHRPFCVAVASANLARYPEPGDGVQGLMPDDGPRGAGGRVLDQFGCGRRQRLRG